MRAFSLGVAALALLGTTTYAEVYTVTQAGKRFSERALEIGVGDTIIFVNDDEHTHNVHSASDGNAFDLGAQAPGTESPVTFTSRGEVDVRCAIHPRMRMTVVVE